MKYSQGSQYEGVMKCHQLWATYCDVISGKLAPSKLWDKPVVKMNDLKHKNLTLKTV